MCNDSTAKTIETLTKIALQYIELLNSNLHIARIESASGQGKVERLEDQIRKQEEGTD